MVWLIQNCKLNNKMNGENSMRDFIFLIGPSAVGKTTLAKKLYEHYNGVYIEQSMVPEFVIPDGVSDVGVYEEDLCFENTLMQMKWFHDKGYRNIVALDFDDLRVRSFPELFKGYNFIILRLISSDFSQIKNQMEERHKTGNGLYIENNRGMSNEVIRNRPLMPNEVIIDVSGKNKEQVLAEAIQVIDTTPALMDYDYKLLDKSYFRSWIQSYGLNQE